jgi:hypothetical protein
MRDMEIAPPRKKPVSHLAEKPGRLPFVPNYEGQE